MALGDQKSGNTAEPTPLTLAMDTLITELHGMVKLLDDRELDGIEPAGQIGFAQQFERFRNQLALVDHRIINALDRSGAAERYGQRTTARMLVQALRDQPRGSGPKSPCGRGRRGPDLDAR